MIGEAIRDFWFLHGDVVLGRIYWVLWTALVIFATTLVNRWRYRLRAIKEAREDLKQKVVELQLVGEEKDRTITRQAELIQKLAIDRRSAEALGKAIGNAIGAGPG